MSQELNSNISNKVDPVYLSAKVSYLVLLNEQIKHSKETRDKWFKYFLMITGIPLGLAATLLQVEVIRGAIERPEYIIMSTSFFFCMLGTMFLLIYIRQRSNYLFIANKLSIAETEFVTQAFMSKSLHEINNSPIDKSLFNADFYTNCIYIFFNSIWGGIFIVTLVRVMYPESSIALLSVTLICGFLITLLIQFFIRSRLLAKNESAFYK